MGDGTTCHYCRRYKCVCDFDKVRLDTLWEMASHALSVCGDDERQFVQRAVDAIGTGMALMLAGLNSRPGRYWKGWPSLLDLVDAVHNESCRIRDGDDPNRLMKADEILGIEDAIREGLLWIGASRTIRFNSSCGQQQEGSEDAPEAPVCEHGGNAHDTGC